MILDVLIEARFAGRLDLTRPQHPVFTYDEAYARDRDATPLSTLFPPAAAPPEGETLLWWLQVGRCEAIAERGRNAALARIAKGRAAAAAAAGKAP